MIAKEKQFRKLRFNSCCSCTSDKTLAASIESKVSHLCPLCIGDLMKKCQKVAAHIFQRKLTGGRPGTIQPKRLDETVQSCIRG